MIKEAVQEAINRQIVHELYSSNLYLSMAGYFKRLNLIGFSSWMRIQAQEELAHALKFFDYILERNGHAKVGAIEAPPIEFESPISVFIKSLEHEKQVTKWIDELADLAVQEHDHATQVLLQWFIQEQVEEESNVTEIVERLRLAGDSKSSLFIMDNELRQRKVTRIGTSVTPAM